MNYGHLLISGNDTVYAQSIRIVGVSINAAFNPANYDNDIGIVQTGTPILFNQAVGPVCLPFRYLFTCFVVVFCMFVSHLCDVPHRGARNVYI